MRKSKTRRIDYKVFGRTGEKVYRSDSEADIAKLNKLMDNWSLGDNDQKMNQDKLHQLDVDQYEVREYIKDFIEDREDMTFANADEINDVLEKIGELRSRFKRTHKELQELCEDYSEKYGKDFATVINGMKSFVKAIQQQKKVEKIMADQEKEKEIQVQKEKVTFQVECINRTIGEFLEVFCADLDVLNIQEIKRRRKASESQLKEVRTIGDKIQAVVTAGYKNAELTEVVDDTRNRYEKLLKLKGRYMEHLHFIAEEKEIDKNDMFQVSSMNIKLQKFKDYTSPLDIYTFQSTFEKIYLKTTPKYVLSEILKNNYLEGQALSYVKNIDDIDEIWKRLKSAFGNSKIMLSKKLSQLENIDSLWKHKQPARILEGLSKLTNCMRDLISLAEKHDIEKNLFYGDSIDKIYKICGDERMTRWFNIQCDKKYAGKELWNKLLAFLEKEIKINQQKALFSDFSYDKKPSNLKNTPTRHFFAKDDDQSSTKSKLVCFICGKDDHVASNGPGGTKIIQYFSCKTFVDMSPAERCAALMKKGFCFQCLYPGGKYKQPRHKEGRCQSEFSCKHESHDKFTTKMHVLICDEHKDLPENQDLLQSYKEKCILRQQNIPEFSKKIKLSFHSTINGQSSFKARKKAKEVDSVLEKAIYMLQTIEVDGKKYTIFYDTGCDDFVARYDAIKRIGNRARKEFDGVIKLGGVGNVSTESKHGIYSVRLPLINGREALMTGVCLDQITQTFPYYPLGGNVEEDIKCEYLKSGGNLGELPKLPKEIGGDVDFMVGIKYLRYFPELVFQMTSGLTIFRSCFRNADGTLGVIGGPHHAFTEVDMLQFGASNNVNFTRSQATQKLDILDFMEEDLRCDIYDDKSNAMLTKKLKHFEKAEEAGSLITYRCVNCRECSDCKSQEKEIMSIKEEVEQELIERSVTVDLEKRITTGRLPFIHDPEVKLTPNKSKALKVLEQQVRKLSKNKGDREDVVNSEKKLQTLGHVDYFDNLEPDIQKMLTEHSSQNYIPWRAVWKPSSLSTPCRMVFDASQPTDSGFSLNDIVGKGRNNMNKLVEIFLRWRTNKVALHTDIQKMYNCVKLDPRDWCYQRYLWRDDLSEANPIVQKIIKTLIYGVRCSGNMSETGLRKTAKLSEAEYPEACEIVMKDTYVDDCMSGETSSERAVRRADELEVILQRGGFSLKGITMSGTPPQEHLSSDGCSVNIAGLKWKSEEDIISLDVPDINFAKKHRGKKTDTVYDVPEKLTRRQCASKVAEIFDLTGIFTPIVATFKLDLHDLVLRKLDWDDVLPDNLRQIWVGHFDMMAEIRNVRYHRAVIPDDASELKIQTLGFGDASKRLACIAIYVRFPRRSGEYSCQLLFARSRLVPDGTTQPRAELFAAVVNSHAGEVVRRALVKYHDSDLKFSDSQIALHWLSNESRTLKQWVRNRVIEILRFTDIDRWRYVASEEMVADLGTRPSATLDDVVQSSEWINGKDWMKLGESEFPAYTIDEVKLNNAQLKEEKQERHLNIMDTVHVSRKVPDEVKERYEFSTYVIDPNKFRYKKVLRVLAMVIRFVNILKTRIKGTTPNIRRFPSSCLSANSMTLEDDEIECAENYFFRKATEEVKHFLPEKSYSDMTKEKQGILYFVGRILPSDTVTIVGKMTDAMKDLSVDTFVVPFLDKHSPLAYSIISDIHWHHDDVKHRGIESVWRYVLKKVYVLGGRNILKAIKSSCQRCRFLEKKMIEVSMAPVSPTNLTIAPAFFHTQVDLTGPFLAYSHHQKRKTIKIWLSVFCCNSTYATSIKVMEDYSSAAFIQTFIRFCCQFGYPSLMLSDEGSQIVKSFESLELTYTNIKAQLKKDYHVNYEVCPVGGHNMNGKVERKIREVKVSLERMLQNCRLSIMQWETVSAQIANEINNLPLALGNIVSDFETMDLLTPNRLLLGRNNERSLTGSVVISSNPLKIEFSNQAIFNSWFENWLLSHVPKLVSQPKWFKSDEDLQVGDVVLFTKAESPLSSTYQYGIVKSVYISRDGKIRKAEVSYRNHTESVNRTTFRAVRELVIIHHIDEVDIMDELNEMAR